MNSIRNKLLLILSIVLTLAWILVTAITYLESQHEVEEVFDAQMAQSAAVLSQFSSSLVGKPTPQTHKLQKEFYGHRYEKKLSFQIWEADRLILRSANAPAMPMASSTGYSDQTINKETWRVFALQLAGNKTIYVGEKYEVRNELINEITLQALYPLTLALPILALLVWFSLGQALKPLKKLASEIEQRSSNNLEPVNNRADIPAEISPIISALNNLFLRVKSAFEREKQFTSDASHELRTPLASIKIQAQVAMRADSDTQRQHAIEQIIQSVDRTTHLVEQMLTLARLDPEVAFKQLTNINLSELVEDVLREFSGQARNRGMRLEFDRPDNDLIIKGHDAAIAILLRNLLTNAFTYSPDQTDIVVRLHETADDIQLMVIDNGPGIPREERDQVLNRFHRGENTQHQPGSGLGLSIAQRIAELHKASLNISDNPHGPGACVTVVFHKQIS
jgi:two-component system sensor histidine kinase QseC